MEIPSVNLADFLSGDVNQKAAFVEKLGKAYEEIGFVTVKNHGVSDELIADLYIRNLRASVVIHLLVKSKQKVVKPRI